MSCQTWPRSPRSFPSGSAASSTSKMVPCAWTVVAVSSLPPARGIDELAEALDDRRERIDLAARRVRARRRHALADFAAEHGDRGLRALGGRREGERYLDEQDPGLDVPALEARLEERAAAAD